MGKISKTTKLQMKQVSVTGEKTIRAVVTARTIDRDGEIIDTPSLRLPLKAGGWVYARDLTGNEELDIPFLINHSFAVEDVIGSARAAIINGSGELEVTFGVSSLAKGQDMFTLLEEGHLGNAFSITIGDYTFGPDNVYYNGEVHEISLVFRASNRDARLLAISKSLINKESKMSTKQRSPELDAKYKQLEALTKEIEAEENTEEEPEQNTEPETQPTPNETEPRSEEKVEETPPPPQQPPAPAEEERVNKAKEPTAMKENIQTSVATKSVQAKPSEVEQESKPVVKTNSDEHKLITAKQINAFNQKNWEALRELNEKAKKIDQASGLNSKSIKSKEVSYDDASPLYLAEQVSRDVELCRGEYGLSPLVTRIELRESTKFTTLTQDGDIDFVPVGWAGEKPEDQTGFGRVSVEPKPFAVIQVWNDHAADDAMVNLYNIMVQNVADAEQRLEDRLIATFETVTADGVVYPDQGIVPRLDSGQIFSHGGTGGAGGTGEQFFATLLQALGSIRNCDANNVTLAFNRSYVYALAGLRNTNGDLIFTGTGNTLNLGMLGNVRFVTTDVLDAGDVLIGNFRRGYLGTKGGLQLTTSNQAIVGERNLFTTDHTALRAVVRKEFDTSEGSLAGAYALVRPTA